MRQALAGAKYGASCSSSREKPFSRHTSASCAASANAAAVVPAMRLEVFCCIAVMLVSRALRRAAPLVRAMGSSADVYEVPPRRALLYLPGHDVKKVGLRCIQQYPGLRTSHAMHA